MCCVNCARCMCVHMVIFLPAYKMCKRVKVPGSLQLHIWRSAVRRRCFQHLYRTVMGNVAPMTRRTVCLSILSCLGLYRVIPCPVFGSFRCLWSVSVFIHQLNQTRSLKRVQMAAFTLIQMNHTNRAIASELVLIKANLPSVNTPYKSRIQFIYI